MSDNWGKNLFLVQLYVKPSLSVNSSLVQCGKASFPWTLNILTTSMTDISYNFVSHSPLLTWNRWSIGRSWKLEAPGPVAFFQNTWGWGLPSARHEMRMVWFITTVLSSGGSTNVGGTVYEIIRDNYRDQISVIFSTDCCNLLLRTTATWKGNSHCITILFKRLHKWYLQFYFTLNKSFTTILTLFSERR